MIIEFYLNSVLPLGKFLIRAKEIKKKSENLFVVNNELEEIFNNSFVKMKNDDLLNEKSEVLVDLKKQIDLLIGIKPLIDSNNITIDNQKLEIKNNFMSAKETNVNVLNLNNNNNVEKIKDGYSSFSLDMSNYENNLHSILSFYTNNNFILAYVNYLENNYNEEGYESSNLFLFDIENERDNFLTFFTSLLSFCTSLEKASNNLKNRMEKKIDLSIESLDNQALSFELSYNNLFLPFDNLYKIEPSFSLIKQIEYNIVNNNLLSSSDFQTLKDSLNLMINIFNAAVVEFDSNYEERTEVFISTYKKYETPYDQFKINKNKKKKIKSMTRSFGFSDSLLFRDRYYELSLLLSKLRIASNSSINYYFDNQDNITFTITRGFNPVVKYNYLNQETLIKDLPLDESIALELNTFNFFEHKPNVEDLKSAFDFEIYFVSNNEEQIHIDNTHLPMSDFYKEESKNWGEEKQTAYLFYRMELLSYLFSSFRNFESFWSENRFDVYESNRLFAFYFYPEDRINKSSDEIDIYLIDKLTMVDHSLCYLVHERHDNSWFFNLIKEFKNKIDAEININRVNLTLKDLKDILRIFFKFGISFLIDSRKRNNYFEINLLDDANVFLLPYVSLNSYSNNKEVNLLVYLLNQIIKLELELKIPFELFSLKEHEILASWLFQDKNTCAALVSYEDLAEFYGEAYLTDDIDLIRDITILNLQKYWNSSSTNYPFINLFKLNSGDLEIDNLYSDLFKKLYLKKETIKSEVYKINTPDKNFNLVPFEDILYPTYNEGNYLYFSNIITPNDNIDSLKVLTYRIAGNQNLYLEIESGNYFINQDDINISWTDQAYRVFDKSLEFYSDENNSIENIYAKKIVLLDFFKTNIKLISFDFKVSEFFIVDNKRVWKQESKEMKCFIGIDEEGDFILLDDQTAKAEEDILLTEYNKLMKEITDLYMSNQLNETLKSKITQVKQEKYKIFFDKNPKEIVSYIDILETTLNTF